MIDRDRVLTFIKDDETQIAEFKTLFQKEVMEFVVTFKKAKDGKKHNIIESKFEEMQKVFHVILYKEKVNEGVKPLYELIVKKRKYRSPFFAKALDTSVKNIERWLNQLKDEKKIEFIGSPKIGGYYVKYT